ncbi:helix-turn-helix domain-containing protein [Candidatus Formimonas warabiya]|uniref:Helix-turn-helix domain-containing protein n=1 Tax=Formimonas warabiya TaxID=1761012 RepID=A0A3G1L0M4_FORW1|nr:helix-turn-helix domain-containing protein [Candidatus Formimonas warabiya]ATW28201.1 hypothetical protein DCMF_28670 [Candidatus Formimonas warabiya]
MEALNNRLLQFNSMMLLNKREVLESFDDFVAHHRKKDNEEGYSEGKRKVLLSLCDEFRNELEKSDIPTLTKPWLYYDYSITNDGIELSLFKCDNDIEFDDEGEISSMSSSEEYTLVKVKCDYLTVEQYAELYDVTTTTVRQWIRRGKLRTAKKKGRDWLIPALADKPKRGFESATYHWNVLSSDILAVFPFLAETNRVYLFQDDEDKKLFNAITGWPGENNRQQVKLTTKEREQLEIMLIAAPGVKVEDLSTGVRYVPAKRNFLLPVLSYQDDSMTNKTFSYSNIIVQQHSSDTAHFSPDNEPRDSFSFDYTSTYLVPVHWTFWGVPHDADDIFYDALDNGNYADCTKIGVLSGQLILCKQMIANGYDPLTVCDDESADLEYVMSALVDQGGPLNEWTGEPLLDIFYIHELTIEESLQRQGLGSRILQELPCLCRELLHVVPDILTYYPAPTERNWHTESEREVALRNIAVERVAKAITPDHNVNQNTSNTISFADKYRFSDDETKMIMGCRHSGSSYPEVLKNIRLIAFYQKNGFQELGDTRLLYAYTEM